MSSVPLSRKQKIVAVAVIVVACVAIDRAFAFWSQWTKSIDNRTVRIEDRLRQAQRILTERDAIESAEKELFFNQASDRLKDVASLLSEVDAFAVQSGVSVTSLRPATGRSEPVVAINFEGTWPATIQFLSLAQARPHYFSIRELRIDRKDPDQKLQISCVLVPASS